MDIGVIQINSGECISDKAAINIDKISYELGKYGYFVKLYVCLSDDSDISETFDYVLKKCDSVLICGNINAFYDTLSNKYEISRGLFTFMIEEKPCAVAPVCDLNFIFDKFIPMLNAKCKTFYATGIFRTIGKTEEQIKTLLKNYIKNRNKISFKFVSDPPQCTVLVRYSNKTQKNTVYEILSGVASTLKDCIYSCDETPLENKVADLLISQNKTLGLAESFTGGNIAASLVQFPGISKSLKEGIVCYSNDVKQNRLNVSREILDTYGAVSVETAYEMAVNLLMNGNYDCVVATTGNAGPTSEKPDEVGICYIAVGDRHNIDIYPYRFEGDRNSVIRSGTQTALYHLLKLLSTT